MPSPSYSRLIATIGGRRFLLSILSLVSITFLNAYGTLDSSGYAIALGATVAAYIAGDTHQKVSAMKATTKSEQEQ